MLSRLWKLGGRKGSYKNMRQYVMYAKQLGLVEVLRTEQIKTEFAKNFYRLTSKGRTSGLWQWLQGFVSIDRVEPFPLANGE